MKKVILLTLFLALFSFGYSDENNILKSVLVGFDATKPLLNEAQKNADRQDRFRFSYHYLYSDLNVIKRGLRSAVWGQERGNFQPTNLHGDYGFVGRTEEAKLLQMFINEMQYLKSEVVKAQRIHSLNRQSIRKINFNFIIADMDSVMGKIQNALAGSGSHARTYPMLRGGHW